MDPDLIAWLDAHGKGQRSAVVNEALKLLSAVDPATRAWLREWPIQSRERLIKEALRQLHETFLLAADGRTAGTDQHEPAKPE